MLKATVLTIGLTLGSQAATDSSRDVTYRTMNTCRQGGCVSPVFDKGYFFQLKETINTPSDGYALWNPDGELIYQVSIVAPDGTPGHLREPAIDTDGTAIVPISYGGYGGRGRVIGGGIVVVDPSGKQTQFIDTGRWLPAHVAVTWDHSIFAMGTQFAPLEEGDKDHVSGGDYRLIRKYSRDGKLAGEVLQRSLFPAGLPPAETGAIRIAGERVEVLAFSGMTADRPEWLELDLDGTLLGRWQLGILAEGDPVTRRMTFSRWVYSFAVTADGRLFAAVSRSKTAGELQVFDRVTSTWKAADLVAPEHSSLVGAVGNDLVFQNRSDVVRLRWMTVAEAH
jgi:hypothetical protein